MAEKRLTVTIMDSPCESANSTAALRRGIDLDVVAEVSIIKVIVLMFFAIVGIATGHLTARPALAQVPQACIEDFASDTDLTMPGFAGSVFSHSISGHFEFWSGAPGDPSGHVLALFAGATDVVTFPGQTVTYAKVQIFSFSPGMIIFEGVADILTTRFSPLPFAQFREATDTTPGDNGQPLGEIVKVTLVGFETLFDNIEISPCMSAPSSTMVDVLVRPDSINPRRNNGLMKAVILSNTGFDAETVDPTTVQFGAAADPFRYFFGDEDEDGDIDLIFFFLVGEVGIQCGDTAVRLSGQTTTGQFIEGEGLIQTVGCP